MLYLEDAWTDVCGMTLQKIYLTRVRMADAGSEEHNGQVSFFRKKIMLSIHEGLRFNRMKDNEIRTDTGNKYGEQYMFLYILRTNSVDLKT